MSDVEPEWTGPPRFYPPVEPILRADGARLFAGITYARISGYRPLLLDLWVPATAPPAPLVVWIHGGAWLSGDRRYLPETLRPNQLFDALVAAGLAVATVDYRHAREAPFPAQLHDVKAALRYLRTFAATLGVNTTRVGVWGESAGGHLAALLGLTADRTDLEGTAGVPGRAGAAHAVVDWYGVADPDALPRMPPAIGEMIGLPEHPPDLLLGGVEPATHDDAAPLRQVHPDAPPFLLLHGTADRVVPFAQSEELRRALRAAGVPVELIPVEGADHIFAGYPDVDGLVDRSVRFLADALTAG
jgi:acetyl esterase/lipase